MAADHTALDAYHFEDAGNAALAGAHRYLQLEDELNRARNHPHQLFARQPLAGHHCQPCQAIQSITR